VVECPRQARDLALDPCQPWLDWSEQRWNPQPFKYGHQSEKTARRRQSSWLPSPSRSCSVTGGVVWNAHSTLVAERDTGPIARRAEYDVRRQDQFRTAARYALRRRHSSLDAHHVIDLLSRRILRLDRRQQGCGKQGAVRLFAYGTQGAQRPLRHCSGYVFHVRRELSAVNAEQERATGRRSNPPRWTRYRRYPASRLPAMTAQPMPPRAAKSSMFVYRDCW